MAATQYPQKPAVAGLTFDKQTARRVAWESWEFTVTGPNQVEVTNASYGYLKRDHTYAVTVEQTEGREVPTECECPADVHHESACKHRLALATVGGPTVMKAAVARSASECDCAALSDGFPCWPCVRDGNRDVTERTDREVTR